MIKQVSRTLAAVTRADEARGDFQAMETMALLCAILASLALGVLAAYGICQAMFRLFQIHAVSAAKNRVAGQPLQAAQG